MAERTEGFSVEYTLTPQQLQLDRRIQGLREQNLKTMNDLAQVGANLDLATARIEHQMNKLVEFGIITRDQLLEEQEAWELHLRSQLKMVREKIEAVQRQKGGAVRKESGLIIPGAGTKVT